MMSTGFTGSKNGDMPQMMKWMYIMILKHNGFVTNYSEERIQHDCDFGWRTIRYFTIKSPGRTLEVTIDDEGGVIDGQMTAERNYQPVYELGSSKPAAFVPDQPHIYYRSE